MRRLLVIESSTLVGNAIAKRLSSIAETATLICKEMIDMDRLPQPAPDAVLVNTRLAAMNQNGRKVMHAYRDRGTGERYTKLILRREPSDDVSSPDLRRAYHALLSEGIPEVRFDAHAKPRVVGDILDKICAAKGRKAQGPAAPKTPAKPESPESQLVSRVEQRLGIAFPKAGGGASEEQLAKKHTFRMEYHPEDQEIRLFGFAAEKDMPAVTKMLNYFAREMMEVTERTRQFYLNFEGLLSVSVEFARDLAAILGTQVKLRTGKGLEKIDPRVQKVLRLYRFDSVRFRTHNPRLREKGGQFLFLLRDYVVRNKTKVEVIAKARGKASDLYRES